MSSKTAESKNYEFAIEDIKGFKSAVNGKEFKSPFFELGGFKWCLRIFPNGSTKAKRGNVNCFVWLRSLPPKYSKVAVNITLTLKEANVTASFPHQFTDNHVTRGWITGTLKTADIQKLESLTFAVSIDVHDVYGASGNLLSGDDEKASERVPPLNKQSSELILDKQNIHDSRLDSLTLKMEELILKFDNMQNAMDALSEKQEETDNNFNSLVNEIKNMQKYLGDDYKATGDLLMDINDENLKLKNWLERECKMGQYFQLFIQNGVENMTICKLLSMDNLETMGIAKLGHRVTIAHQIAKLNQKMQDID